MDIRKMKEIELKLKEELKEANWDMLADHHKKENVIWVSQELDLIDVGVSIAKDNTVAIKKWMDESSIYKPKADQVTTWEKSPYDKTFIFLIIQPYVLIQQKLN
jgi:hypothetical protein